MSTTTIRLEEAMKARVAAAAERAGKTAHAFILEAISQTVEQAELHDAFLQLADQRWEKLRTDGQTVAWEEAHDYLLARAGGAPSSRPKTHRRSA